MLTKEQIEEIDSIQKKMQKDFRLVPPSGKIVEYLGKEFILYKNVFWPFEDSKPLIVENFKIARSESVLDVGTGSGVIAIFAAYNGAERVVALDINPEAVRCAKENSKKHGFEKIIEVRLSDVFESVKPDEKFDVVTANLPFRNKKASDFVEASQWDTDFQTHKKFFSGVDRILKPKGRIYMSQSNFGDVDEMKRLAHDAGFSVSPIGENKFQNDPRIFYAFEMKRVL